MKKMMGIKLPRGIMAGLSLVDVERAKDSSLADIITLSRFDLETLIRAAYIEGVAGRKAELIEEIVPLRDPVKVMA